MYAIQLSDLLCTGHETERMLLSWLIRPVMGQAVDVEPAKFDGAAVVLECDEERAAAIVAVIRAKYKRNQVRCWQSKSGAGSWKMV
jgi:hypothetical protein